MKKDCKTCANVIDEEAKYCTGDKVHHLVDQTGENKCWTPKHPCYECENCKDDYCSVLKSKINLEDTIDDCVYKRIG